VATFQIMETGALIGLLQTAENRGGKFVCIKDDRILLGENPLHPDLEIDFGSDKISARDTSAINGTQAGIGQPKPQEPNAAQSLGFRTRVRGAHWFVLLGERSECRSVKDLFLSALKSLETKRPGTFEKLSHVKKRTKRIISRNRTALFEKQHLVEDYSLQIADGWWVGTNNSSQEVESWLRQAIECAGLQWGRDFTCSL
jgi:hypothetical protein